MIELVQSLLRSLPTTGSFSPKAEKVKTKYIEIINDHMEVQRLTSQPSSTNYSVYHSLREEILN